MKIPGLKEFHEALPDYSEKQTRRLFLNFPLFIIIFLLVQILLIFTIPYLSNILDTDLMNIVEICIPIVFSLTFILLGSVIAQLGFTKKKKLLSKYGERAFQHIVRIILLGISMVISGVAFAYVPIKNSSSTAAILLSKTFDSAINHVITAIVRYIIAGFIVFISVMTLFRAIQEFGIATASLVYVYFPERGKIVHSEIYSIIRHPMYYGAILLSIGGFFVNFSIYALIQLIVTLITFYRHVFLIEEKELIERFGDSYIQYSHKTPALYIHPKNWGKFLKFLFHIKNRP